MLTFYKSSSIKNTFLETEQESNFSTIILLNGKSILIQFKS